MSEQFLRPDEIGIRREQWAKGFYGVDTQPMAIIGRLRRITLLTRPEIEKVFTRHGLGIGEFDVLNTLVWSGPPYRLRPTEISKSLMISSGGLTDQLSRLAKAGFITRPRSEEDAMTLHVQLTPTGLEQIEAAFREDMKVEAALLANLARADLSELERLLSKLLSSLEQNLPSSS